MISSIRKRSPFAAKSLIVSLFIVLNILVVFVVIAFLQPNNMLGGLLTFGAAVFLLGFCYFLSILGVVFSVIGLVRKEKDLVVGLVGLVINGSYFMVGNAWIINLTINS